MENEGKTEREKDRACPLPAVSSWLLAWKCSEWRTSLIKFASARLTLPQPIRQQDSECTPSCPLSSMSPLLLFLLRLVHRKTQLLSLCKISFCGNMCLIQVLWFSLFSAFIMLVSHLLFYSLFFLFAFVSSRYFCFQCFPFQVYDKSKFFYNPNIILIPSFVSPAVRCYNVLCLSVIWIVKWYIVKYMNTFLSF